MTDTPETEKEDISIGFEIKDRAIRKAEKEKKRKEALEAQNKKTIDKVKIEGILAQKEKAKKKNWFRLAGSGVGVALLFWLINFLFTPFKGDARFGVCKVFLENYVRYPTHLRVSSVEDFGNSLRIWYAQTDAFGAYRLESMQCFFKYDEQRGTIVEKITVNRLPVDQKRIDAFNVVLPVVLQNLPDLTFPTPLPDSLGDLQIDADMFRQRLNL